MTPQRVTLITLGVDDLDRAKAFYAALGWQVTREIPGQVVFYQINGMALGFFSKAGLAQETGRDLAELGTGASTLARNMPTEAEVDTAFDAAIAAGATPLARPSRMAWGGYSSYFADPDGHVWEIAHNPWWPLHPDGSLTLPGAIQRIDEPALLPTDEAQIATLLADAFGTDFGGRSYFHQRPHHRHVVRDDDGYIAAHLAVHHRAIRMGPRLITIAGIADVATASTARKQGHAGRLLAQAMTEASSGLADFVVLFGDRPLYAGMGFAAQQQRLRYTDLTGAQTGQIVTADSDGLMVWPCGDLAWDRTAEVDLLGDKF